MEWGWGNTKDCSFCSDSMTTSSFFLKLFLIRWSVIKKLKKKLTGKFFQNLGFTRFPRIKTKTHLRWPFFRKWVININIRRGSPTLLALYIKYHLGWLRVVFFWFFFTLFWYFLLLKCVWEDAKKSFFGTRNRLFLSMYSSKTKSVTPNFSCTSSKN